MPNSRQLDKDLLIRSFSVTFSHRELKPPCSESWTQLVYASRGTLTVKTEFGTWVVPPHRAVWIPAGMTYELGVSGTVALRSIYIRKTRHLSKNLSFDPVNCAVINVSPLLRELILRATKLSVLYASQPFHRRLAGLIEDELRSVSAVPLQLPLPQSAIARDFARRLEQRLDACFDMQELIQECGTSRRTLERLMREETGMSLGQWVRRRKLLAGLQALTDGETVGAVAFRLSYSSPSAFIAMFKRELGMAPGEYIAA